jgi:hypothetical protein
MFLSEVMNDVLIQMFKKKIIRSRFLLCFSSCNNDHKNSECFVGLRLKFIF